MRHLSLVVILLFASGFVSAQEKKGPAEVPLSTATGVVDKADKDTLTIQPRKTDDKFQIALTLNLTGTSKVAVLTPQKRGDKVVLPQREIEGKDLVSGQSIAVIYSEAGKDGLVLLTAIAHLAPSK